MPFYVTWSPERGSRDDVPDHLDVLSILREGPEAYRKLERLSASDLELIRGEIHKASDHARSDLEKLEAVLILARQREAGEGGEL